jgi:hypothetical protein
MCTAPSPGWFSERERVNGKPFARFRSTQHTRQQPTTRTRGKDAPRPLTRKPGPASAPRPGTSRYLSNAPRPPVRSRASTPSGSAQPVGRPKRSRDMAKLGAHSTAETTRASRTWRGVRQSRRHPGDDHRSNSQRLDDGLCRDGRPSEQRFLGPSTQPDRRHVGSAAAMTRRLDNWMRHRGR